MLLKIGKMPRRSIALEPGARSILKARENPIQLAEKRNTG